MSINTAFKSQPILIATNVDAVGSAVEVSKCYRCNITFRFRTGGAALGATLTIGGSNIDPIAYENPQFPPLLTGKQITPVVTGMTFDPATGVVTANNLSAGISELTVAYTDFPKWIAATYDYTSGGGTMDVLVQLSCW